MSDSRVFQNARSQLLGYDLGAHLASWMVDGEPVIWLSPDAVLDGSAAIRGGVPICFPWFAAGPDGTKSPRHGVVRTARWIQAPTLEGSEELWAWELTSDALAGAPGMELLPGRFRARYAVSLSAEQSVSVDLEITNLSDHGYQFEVALHTYLAVSNVEQVDVVGLEGAEYWDKVKRTRRIMNGVLRPAGEVDIVVDRAGPVQVIDPGGHGISRRTLAVDSHGATQTVVWNPGPVAAAQIGDIPAEAWSRFICVETAATGAHSLHLPAGGSIRVGARYSVVPR